MTLDEFIERAPASLEAFKLATLVQRHTQPEFNTKLEDELDWWKEVLAYMMYVEVAGDGFDGE